jgi:ribonuclease Z
MSVNSTILEKNPRLQKIQRYHTNTEQFSEVLESVKPRVAVMTHVIVVGTSDDNVLQQVIEHYEGDLYMGEDLMSFELGNSIKVIPY